MEAQAVAAREAVERAAVAPVAEGKAKEEAAIRASMEIAARAAAEAMHRQQQAERNHRWAEAAEAAEALKRKLEVRQAACEMSRRTPVGEMKH